MTFPDSEREREEGVSGPEPKKEEVIVSLTSHALKMLSTVQCSEPFNVKEAHL